MTALDLEGARAFSRPKRSYSLVLDDSRDALLTDFGRETLHDRYLLPGETIQQMFARVASAYADDAAHAQRLYDMISKLWFMPATPILSNGGTDRGLPISCFLNSVEDSVRGINDIWNENVWLAVNGGGIGTYWGDVRSIGEKTKNGKTSGIIPFIKVMDAKTLAISQGSLRRGSAAVYLPVWHPEIEEFIEIRRPTGGDPNRKSLNLHNGVVIDDKFMVCVENDADYALRSPKTGETIRTVRARDIWQRILTARIETGEPFLMFIDTVNRLRPEAQKRLGIKVKTSNLCSEITNPCGIDHRGRARTAVCCLASQNLETYDEWQDQLGSLVEDQLRFLDNVLSSFIDSAPRPEFDNAIYSAMRERSVGLGVMGFHSYLQKNGIPFESQEAAIVNTRIFSRLNAAVNHTSAKLAFERGPCLDAKEAGLMERFSNKTAIAPTASISIIAGGASPCIEPFVANAYTHKTLSGSFAVRNRYLEDLLAEKGKNTREVWSSIVANEGSVQHLDFLTPHEKNVFKTAFEIDQRWILRHALDRAHLIDQSQSINFFLTPDADKRDIHRLHFDAWEGGLKSIYYCRSRSLQRADKIARVDVAPAATPPAEECEACQ